MRRYSPCYKDDPRWITAKYPAKCQCGTPVKKNERVYYYPLTRTVLCRQCGEEAERDFHSCKADEDFYNSQY